MMNVLDLTKTLIGKRSITPDDSGCQKLIIDLLKEAKFQIQPLPFDPVLNLWSWHGTTSPLFVFAGHTDVVPPGPEKAWQTPPFTPTEKDGVLYGRGAADMKSGLAAMIIAGIEFVSQHPDHKGTIAYLITSNEEGDSTNGTARVVNHLQQNQVTPDYCIVGEATCKDKLGDVIKIGRRGSLQGNITVIGHQGHIAYPQLADNPIHKSFNAFSELSQHQWDQGNQDFPPTQFQFFEIQSGVGATNVIPGKLTAGFNFRYAPISTPQQLKESLHTILNKHKLKYKIDWKKETPPYFTNKQHLLQCLKQSISTVTNVEATANTLGGTSDGRFIAPTGCEVIEFGPVNASIHKVDEHIKIDDLLKLKDIYYKMLENLLL